MSAQKITVLLFVLLLFGITAIAQKIRKVKIEDVAVLISKADHPLVVNFWATWCRPCIEELPSLQAAVEKNKSTELILISLDFPDAYPDSILNFAKKNKIAATLLWLDETDADHFCPVIDKTWSGAIPVTLLVNNKTQYHRFFDEKINPQQLDAAMKEMLQ